MNFKKLLKLIFAAFAAQASAQTYTTKCASTAAQYDGPKGTYASLDYAKFCMHSNQAGNGVEGTFKNETAVLKPGIRRELGVARNFVSGMDLPKWAQTPVCRSYLRGVTVFGEGEPRKRFVLSDDSSVYTPFDYEHVSTKQPDFQMEASGETAFFSVSSRGDLEVTRKIVAHAEDIKEVKAPAAKI